MAAHRSGQDTSQKRRFRGPAQTHVSGPAIAESVGHRASFTTFRPPRMSWARRISANKDQEIRFSTAVNSRRPSVIALNVAAEARFDDEAGDEALVEERVIFRMALFSDRAALVIMREVVTQPLREIVGPVIKSKFIVTENIAVAAGTRDESEQAIARKLREPVG